jgi:hypothetical protein
MRIRSTGVRRGLRVCAPRPALRGDRQRSADPDGEAPGVPATGVGDLHAWYGLPPRPAPDRRAAAAREMTPGSARLLDLADAVAGIMALRGGIRRGARPQNRHACAIGGRCTLAPIPISIAAAL